MKPSKEGTPEREATVEEIPVEKSNRKKSKEKRDPGSDENSTVDVSAGVHTEVKPSRETTPESEAAAEENPVERRKKKKGKGKRGPESDENTTTDFTAGVHAEVKPSRETIPEREATAEEIPVEKSKKKKEKTDPGSDENSIVVSRSETKLKTTSKDAEEQKVKSPAPVKTNPWGKPMEKKEPESDDNLKPISKDTEAGKTQEQKVKSPAPVKTNPWGKSMEKKEPQSDDKLKTANKDAEAGKTQEQKVKSSTPVKINPWGKSMEKKEPQSDDKLKTANKDAEAGKTQEQKVKSPALVKTNPWGKPMEKKEPESDDNFSVDPPVSVARTEIKLELPSKDTETSRTEEQKVKTVDPAKTNPWGKSDVTVSAKLQSRETCKEADTSIDV